MITLEPISKTGESYILRLGNNLHEHLDPYEFTCVVHIENNVAHIKGGCGVFNPKWKRIVSRKLMELHVTHIVWERILSDGTIKTVGPIKLR